MKTKQIIIVLVLLAMMYPPQRALSQYWTCRKVIGVPACPLAAGSEFPLTVTCNDNQYQVKGTIVSSPGFVSNWPCGSPTPAGCTLVDSNCYNGVACGTTESVCVSLPTQCNYLVEYTDPCTENEAETSSGPTVGPPQQGCPCFTWCGFASP